MPSQLSMWTDNDPERYAEDGGNMPRSRRPRKKKAGGKKQRTSSAATRRAQRTKPAARSPKPAKSKRPTRAAKPKRARSSAKKPRAELPKNREYKTKRGARYVLSRVED